MIGPKHTYFSVARRIAEGLETGEVALGDPDHASIDGTTRKKFLAWLASDRHPEYPDTPGFAEVIGISDDIAIEKTQDGKVVAHVDLAYLYSLDDDQKIATIEEIATFLKHARETAP